MPDTSDENSRKTIFDVFKQAFQSNEQGETPWTRKLSSYAWTRSKERFTKWWNPGKNYANIAGTSPLYRGYRHLKDLIVTPGYAALGGAIGYEFGGIPGTLIGTAIGSAMAYNNLGLTGVKAVGKGYLLAARGSYYAAEIGAAALGIHSLLNRRPEDYAGFLISNIPTVVAGASLFAADRKFGSPIVKGLRKYWGFMSNATKDLNWRIRLGWRAGNIGLGYMALYGLSSGNLGGLLGTAAIAGTTVGAMSLSSLLKKESISSVSDLGKLLSEKKVVRRSLSKVATTIAKHPGGAAAIAVLGSALLSNLVSIGKYESTQQGIAPRPIGMDPNYLNSGQMALASHYAANTYSRRTR